MKTNSSSTLGPVIDRFITLKQSLGLNYTEQARILSSLDRFLADTSNGFNDLTAEAFLEWCKGLRKLTSGTLRLRMQTVRKLCLYRRRSEPNCFVPDDSIFPARHRPICPYIFSVSEIQQLLGQSYHLTRHNTKRFNKSSRQLTSQQLMADATMPYWPFSSTPVVACRRY